MSFDKLYQNGVWELEKTACLETSLVPRLQFSGFMLLANLSYAGDKSNMKPESIWTGCIDDMQLL